MTDYPKFASITGKRDGDSTGEDEGKTFVLTLYLRS